MDERIKHSQTILMSMSDVQLDALLNLFNYYGADTLRGLMTGMMLTRQQHYALPVGPPVDPDDEG